MTASRPVRLLLAPVFGAGLIGGLSSSAADGDR
jgi:hypothetical protein